MNMYCASRLGWIRSSKEASPHAPEELTDPAQADSAASGRTTGTMPSQRLADRTPRAPARHRAKRSGLLVLAAATLLLIPALAYADVPVATISGPVSVAEGDGAVYTVTLEGGRGSEDIVFDYTITGTVSEADYMDAGAGKLTLAKNGDQTPVSGTITIGVAGDTIDEVPETLIVTLTKVTTKAGMVAIGSPNSVTTTILPADTETVSFDIDIDSTAATAAEGAADGVQFMVELSADIDDVMVRYEVIPGTASRSDYTSDSASGTVTITGTTASFSVMPVDDMLAEGEETFTVRLRLVSPPDNVALGMATATGTITDNEMVRAKVTASDTTVVEGSVVTFTVELEGGVGSEDVVVTYHTNAGSADPDDDFEAPEGTLTIPAGDTMGTIDVRTHTDAFLEGTETLIVTLTDASSGVGDVDLMNSVEPAETVIGDPDGTILVSVEDATTTEGEDAKLLVKLSGKVSGAVRVTYTLADDTADSNDYTNTPQPVEIPAGMTTGTITVSTTEDMYAENAETFTVTLRTLTSPEGVEVALGDATATVTIRDDNPLTVTVRGTGRVREGDGATFTVNLNGGMGITPITVDYTATEGTDYVEPAGTLVINPADSLTNVSATISIPTIQDSEADESLVVTLTLTGVRTETGRVTLGTPRVARTTLVSQETVIISVDDVMVTEAASAMASFDVKVVGSLSGTVKLRYETVPGSATSADYTTESDTVDIAATTEDAITIDITDDSLAEGDETFTLNLSLVGAPDNVVLASPSATATITDNDTLSVRLSSRRGTVTEGSAANFLVTLNVTSTADVVVKYTVENTNDDDDDKKDYQDPGTTLTIPAGTNTGTIVISISEDDVLEPTETLQVTIDDVSTATGSFAQPPVMGSPETAEIREAGTVTASMVQTAVTVTEGGEALFPVRLSGKVSVDVTVGYSTGGGDATDTGTGSDYESVDNGELIIKAGETAGTITIDTEPDMRSEDDETFTVTLSDPPTATGLLAGSVVLGTGAATATIRDDDALTVTVEGSDRVVLNGEATYWFRLNGDKTGSADVTVEYMTNVSDDSTEIIIPPGKSKSANFMVGTGSLTVGQRLSVSIDDVSTAAGR